MDNLKAIIFGKTKIKHRETRPVYVYEDHIEVMLPDGKFFKADVEDLDLAISSNWSYSSGKNAKHRYASSRASTGGNKLFHKVVLNADKNVYVDHIDGNTLDNRKKNLRICTRAQNVHNSKKKNTRCPKSNFIGVRPEGKKFSSRIVVNGVRIYIGTFESEKDAAYKYNEYAKKYRGEFAKLNII